MGMPQISGTAQRCPAFLSTFLLAIDSQSSQTLPLHCGIFDRGKAQHKAAAITCAIGIHCPIALWASIFHHGMRLEHSSVSCVPSAQHTCNAQAVANVHDAHADLLVVKLGMTSRWLADWSPGQPG